MLCTYDLITRTTVIAVSKSELIEQFMKAVNKELDLSSTLTIVPLDYKEFKIEITSNAPVKT